MSTLPVWQGIKMKSASASPAEEWSFDNLSLVGVNSYGADVWEQMADHVKKIGHNMREGDGRNPWLVKYIGECIATGMDEGQAREASKQFQSTFYESPLSTTESETVLLSVVTADKRNHPEKYEKMEAYNNKNDKRTERAKALRLIRPNNLAELKAMSGGSKYLITPFVPSGSIIQVVGFNGHGKTLWLMLMLWAASKGMSFGSAHVEKPIRSLYLDFEGSISTLAERLTQCEEMFGPMSDNFSIWNASAAGDDMILHEAESLAKVAELINDTKPQIVVIDTVRQAWSGMEENSPHSWVKVNQAAMALRNAGMTVIIVHHRNKPNQNGHGREAGSTAQLKDLDLQIRVTKVVEDTDQAEREAAIPDSVTQVVDSAGASNTSWHYLRRTLSPTGKLRMVFELSFGKQRQATDNHVTTYVGLVEDTTTGGWSVVSSLTPLQKAVALSSHGCSILDISEKLGVSQPTITNWIQSTKEAKHV